MIITCNISTIHGHDRTKTANITKDDALLRSTVIVRRCPAKVISSFVKFAVLVLRVFRCL